MFAAGRLPNVEGLGLDKAGIDFDHFGIKVNEKLVTSIPNIYALGDCIAGPKFTHTSDVQARQVVQNALFYGENDKNKVYVPYCTYTDPEIAQVGLNEQ